jgi:hypothetical protein
LTISTKGGVGKSSIAQQLACTYLLAKEGEAYLVELDDQNQDSQWLTKSAIKTSQLKVEGDARMAVMSVFSTLAGKNFVLDIGNQTAEDAISAMGGAGMFSKFDAVFIPVRDVGQDLINCVRTIEQIKTQDPAAKIVMVFNAVPVRHPKRLRMLYGKVFDYAEKNGIPLIRMPFVEGYGQSREFGKTLYEIAADADMLKEMVERKYFNADVEGDSAAVFDALAMGEVVLVAKEARSAIEELHTQIELLCAKDKSHEPA